MQWITARTRPCLSSDDSYFCSVTWESIQGNMFQIQSACDVSSGVITPSPTVWLWVAPIRISHGLYLDEGYQSSVRSTSMKNLCFLFPLRKAAKDLLCCNCTIWVSPWSCVSRRSCNDIAPLSSFSGTPQLCLSSCAIGFPIFFAHDPSARGPLSQFSHSRQNSEAKTKTPKICFPMQHNTTEILHSIWYLDEAKTLPNASSVSFFAESRWRLWRATKGRSHSWPFGLIVSPPWNDYHKQSQTLRIPTPAKQLSSSYKFIQHMPSSSIELHKQSVQGKLHAKWQRNDMRTSLSENLSTWCHTVGSLLFNTVLKGAPWRYLASLHLLRLEDLLTSVWGNLQETIVYEYVYKHAAFLNICIICLVSFCSGTCCAGCGDQIIPVFRRLIFQKWSKTGVFCTFLFGHALRPTTAYNFMSHLGQMAPRPPL